MHSVDSEVDAGSLSCLHDLILELLLYFCHNLLDACRMNTSVNHELVKCKTSHLSSYRVESRQKDSFRCVVNNDFNSGCSLESADVTAFTTDDAALDFITFNVEDCDCIFDGCF